jgi:carboxyl-terminal processing protease
MQVGRIQPRGISCRSVSYLLAAFATAIVLAFAPSTALSLDSLPREPVTIAPQALPSIGLSSVLEKGRQLESKHLWGEVLTYYEKSLREHPGNQELVRRQDLAKLHYSLDHRYHDRSFQQSITTLDLAQALSLYSDLLSKINTHYVTTPSWQKIGMRGARAMDIALANTQFLTTNSLQESPEQIASLRQILFHEAERRTLRGMNDLVAMVGDMARLAQRQAGLQPSATVLEYVTAAVGGLDDYSAYLTSDQLRDVYSQIEGNFVGLGVELKADHGALLIVHVIADSPAERVEIRQGDRIIAVDGQTTSELSTDEAAALLTGAEGTWVQVTLKSPGGQSRQINIRREHVDVPSLESVKIVDAHFGVAYVKIPTFQKSTSRDLETALWDLHRQGMRSLILDLRGNPGGLLTAAVEVADKFLTRGAIVSTRGRSPQEDFNYQAHYGGTWQVPIVVMIDGDSASASEIFAGAIKDNHRGVLVGSRSYGKGSVQGIFPLGYAGVGVRLTTAKFYSPKGVAISHRGVLPDRTIPQQTHHVARATDQGQFISTSAQDLALQEAIEAARGRVAGSDRKPQQRLQ